MPTQLTPSKQQIIWRTVVSDDDALRALGLLKRRGIDLQSGTWPARIVAIPFLPNRRATTRLIVPPRSARLVIRFLNELVAAFGSPYGRLEAYDRQARVFHMKPSLDRETPVTALKQAADLLQKILSLRWAVAEHNPRQNEIASLRWEIRFRTGQPHDTELVDLLNVVFEAAGFKDGFRMDYAALKKLLKNETNTRMALRKKVQPPRHRSRRSTQRNLLVRPLPDPQPDVASTLPCGSGRQCQATDRWRLA
jgi:hypothetical protein